MAEEKIPYYINGFDKIHKNNQLSDLMHDGADTPERDPAKWFVHPGREDIIFCISCHPITI